MWLPLSWALNMVNRSMGRDDLYPFVLPKAVLEKMLFIHTVIDEVTSNPEKLAVASGETVPRQRGSRGGVGEPRSAASPARPRGLGTGLGTRRPR
jgi:hypothetical protein